MLSAKLQIVGLIGNYHNSVMPEFREQISTAPEVAADFELKKSDAVMESKAERVEEKMRINRAAFDRKGSCRNRGQL